MQSGGKLLHLLKSLLGVFGQGLEHDLLNLAWDGWVTLPQQWGWQAQVLHHHLAHRALEWASATEPFVDNHCQRILVTRRARVALDLLRGHIGDSTRCPLH